jgi:SpoVK/Ycf46/Vps4 family AAA+-type ATPase
LDGVEQIDGVFVIAISSRPDLIDPAIVRAGRIDQHIRCDIPNFEERYEYLKINLELVRISPHIKTDLEKYDSFIKNAASLTEGFSYGNLIGALRGL